jgi:malic enzyme
LSYRLRHRGLIGVKSKMPIRDMSVLSRIYTPGVGAVCREIAKQPVSSYQLTCRGNSIALISDGSAGYEFGNIGALAVLPKLEAKSVIFKTFANVDAVPMALTTQDADEIVEIVRILAPTFGGFSLESIAAPKCFTIESRIRKAVRVAVLHHEFHAAGIIVLAALHNALKVVGKRARGHPGGDQRHRGGGPGGGQGPVCFGAGQRGALRPARGPQGLYRMEDMDWAKSEVARLVRPHSFKGPWRR